MKTFKIVGNYVVVPLIVSAAASAGLFVGIAVADVISGKIKKPRSTSY